MLKVENLQSYYGASHILHGVSLTVGEGEVVSLLGRNGAGKTTTLRSIIGLTPPKKGTVYLKGEETTGRKPHTMARLGVSYMPETRGIFPSLSVYENLALAAGRRPGPWTIDRVFEIFPRLEARHANGGAQLSGGEQQMLAIGRALLLNPDLLLLDEPTEGLAPIIVQDIQERLEDIKRAGMTILLVEQNFHFATSLADRVYVLGKGAIQWSGTTQEILADEKTQKTWLGV